MRLVLLNFDSLIVVTQIVLLRTVASNQEVAHLSRDVDLSEVSRERLSVSASAFPLELHTG